MKLLFIIDHIATKLIYIVQQKDVKLLCITHHRDVKLLSITHNRDVKLLCITHHRCEITVYYLPWIYCLLLNRYVKLLSITHHRDVKLLPITISVVRPQILLYCKFHLKVARQSWLSPSHLCISNFFAYYNFWKKDVLTYVLSSNICFLFESCAWLGV